MFDSLTHHAYGVAGERDALVREIVSRFEKALQYPTRGNPDFRIASYDVMGIDESRSLKEAAGRQPVTGGRKIFVISARTVTKEAQNALLKLFEEPAPHTHFFLVVPSLETLLPTLRSRLFILRSGTRKEGVASERAKEFLGGSIPTRLKTIQTLIKSADGERGKTALLSFLDELEQTLSAGERTLTATALGEVLRVKRYTRDRAPSFKLLLEHLALVLPKM